MWVLGHVVAMLSPVFFFFFVPKVGTDCPRLSVIVIFSFFFLLTKVKKKSVAEKFKLLFILFKVLNFAIILAQFHFFFYLKLSTEKCMKQTWLEMKSMLQ